MAIAIRHTKPSGITTRQSSKNLAAKTQTRAQASSRTASRQVAVPRRSFASSFVAKPSASLFAGQSGTATPLRLSFCGQTKNQLIRSIQREYARKKDPNFPPACQELPDVRIAGIEKPNYQVQPGKAYSMKFVLPDQRKLPFVVYPDQQGQIEEIEKLLPNGIVRLTAVQKDVRFQVFWLTSRSKIENLPADAPPPPAPWTYSAIAAIPERAHGTFFGREADIERMKQEAAAKAEAEKKAKEAAEAAAAAAAANPAPPAPAPRRRKKAGEPAAEAPKTA